MQTEGTKQWGGGGGMNLLVMGAYLMFRVSHYVIIIMQN